MQKEALMAEFEVLFLHFNKGNCGHHEELFVDFSHGRDLYPTPEYEARMRPVDCDRGFVDFCREIQ